MFSRSERGELGLQVAGFSSRRRKACLLAIENESRKSEHPNDEVRRIDARAKARGPSSGCARLCLKSLAFVGADMQVHALDRCTRRSLAEVVEARDGDDPFLIAEYEQIDPVRIVACLKGEE